MKRFKKILVPTDLSEHSRRALNYGCWLAAEERSSLVILHVANELAAWEIYSEDLVFLDSSTKAWPLDRVLAEASLDLNRFLEPSMANLKDSQARPRK
jgi:nucleotide-binding universal stress UspA family protein